MDMPDGYPNTYEGVVFKVVDKSKSFEEAEKACNDDGGTMAVFTESRFSFEIVGHIVLENGTFIRLGARRESESKTARFILRLCCISLKDNKFTINIPLIFCASMGR